MDSIRFFKFILFLLALIVCVNCNSPHKRSFDQLEIALVSWYYKYHPTIASEHGLSDYSNQIERFDFNSVEEYKADINRFMIELSQIDETKLNDNQFIKYITINNFLFNRYNHILTLNESSYNPKHYLEILYNSLFFIIHDNNLNMDEKTSFIISRLILIPNSIIHIKKNIIYYSDYEIQQSLAMSIRFRKLLDNIPLYIHSEDDILDEIDKYIVNVKKELQKLESFFKKIDKDNVFDKKGKIYSYIESNKAVEFELDYQYLINAIYLNMIDIALPIYKLNNDEPVWVDKEDTLSIIDLTLNEFLKEYPEKNQIVMTLDESLNRINTFSNKILNSNQYDYEIIISDDVYLKKIELYKLWNNKDKMYLFLNKGHYQNTKFQNKFNQYELDLYNIANYYPGKYFQVMNSQKTYKYINDIVVNNYTNSGWGLLSQYILINKGYGGSNNNIYMLVHLKNILNAILKNMIFTNYYLKGETKTEIEKDIDALTFYKKENIEELILEVVNNPLESNFEAIGYLKLKELYDNFGESNLLKFYSILIKNAHLDLNLIKEYKFPRD